MLLDPSTVTIFLHPGYTHIRKALNGLAVMVKDYMNEDPLSGGLYLFCDRQRRILKDMYWYRTGFCLWQNKLEKHKFPWPVTEKVALKISIEPLKILLSALISGMSKAA